MILMREVVLKNLATLIKNTMHMLKVKKCPLEPQATLISHNIKTQKENRDTSPDTKQMKTGMI